MAEVEHHPSALRNRQPILEQLLRICGADAQGLALEVASGTGCHVEAFAPAFPNLTFQPSEYVVVGVDSEERAAEYGKIGSRRGLPELENIDGVGCTKFANVLPAVALDVSAPWSDWPSSVRAKEGEHTLVFCSNTLHISPWECTTGLAAGAGKALAKEGKLLIYGPFKVNGNFVGEDGGAGNANFDASLRQRNPLWGIRDLEEVASVAAKAGLTLHEKVAMPANNLLLHFIKTE
ncbi:hypothetical protein AB1Y20_013141 [Prymnesium parvum]|uniref:DUF938 domain-containing protein n=1 Tax=Prymnesium parvum TaxID=97485 RepID=A0AB34IJS6_PRYPA|mmetsp:Transcript_33607/g.81736  ORF Transcript_33607/g.81736 Transcript_33607/m.81736 type:complete len:235 (-) Transcript_33607:659-1363(-)